MVVALAVVMLLQASAALAVPSWKVVATPASPTGLLNDVACSSASACTAVGAGGQTLALRWNGSAWASQTIPDLGELHGVACPTASSCVTVGVGNQSPRWATSATWNGSSWVVRSVPHPTPAVASTLYSVSCSASNACTGVGYWLTSSHLAKGFIVRWDGATWTTQARAKPSAADQFTFRGVTCLSATSCTAVGFSSLGTGPHAPLVESWNGSTWTIQATPAPAGSTDTYLDDISCSSASACTAAGDWNNAGANVPLVERWDGSSWGLQTVPVISGAKNDVLLGVACPAVNACEATGYYTKASAPTVTIAVIRKWNGTAWWKQTTPVPAGTTKSSLTDVACTSSTLCLAVGYADVSSVAQSLAERYS
jgi:hypothetical protein